MTFRLKEYQRAKVKSLRILSDTAIESTTVPPSPYDEQRKLSQEEQTKAKGLALSDRRVQAIAEDKEYAVRVARANGVVRIAGEPADDDIEVRLVFAEIYMIEDVEASALDVFVDLNEGEITYMFPLGPSGMPELTRSVREKAVAIALNDADVQRLLQGRGYDLTRIGPCQGGEAGRLGANMDISFGRAYSFQGYFPALPGKAEYLDAELSGIEVFVNLKDEKVIQIWPHIVHESMDGGER